MGSVRTQVAKIIFIEGKRKTIPVGKYHANCKIDDKYYSIRLYNIPYGLEFGKAALISIQPLLDEVHDLFEGEFLITEGSNVVATCEVVDIKDNLSLMLDQAMTLDEKNKTDRAIDLLFEHGFGLDPEAVDLLLHLVDLKRLSITLMISVLTISLPLHNVVSYRKEFFKAVKKEIIVREGKSRVKGLIGGLEGKDGGAKARGAWNLINRAIKSS